MHQYEALHTGSSVDGGEESDDPDLEDNKRLGRSHENHISFAASVRLHLPPQSMSVLTTIRAGLFATIHLVSWRGMEDDVLHANAALQATIHRGLYSS